MKGGDRMKVINRLGTSGLVVGTLLVGAAGGSMLSGLIAHAADTSSATTTATTATTPSTATPASGMFKPNEDPTHEAGESAEREAQENAGQRPTVK
jgi:hypothetical protein